MCKDQVCPGPPARERAEDAGECSSAGGSLCARHPFWVSTGPQELTSPAAKHRLAPRFASAQLAVSSMPPTHPMKLGPPGSSQIVCQI